MGYPGELVPISVWATDGEFYAYDITLCVDPELEIIDVQTETPNAIPADKNITVSSFINDNMITFAGYANSGKIGDYSQIGTFYVRIPEYADMGTAYQLWFENEEIGGYAGGSNDNTDNLYIKNSTVQVGMYGDITGDGRIDLYDAIDIAKYLIGMRDYTYEEEIIADYNMDGKVDLYDAIGIAKYLLNNI